MNRGVVLLGFAESLAAPECAWDLVDAGYDVVAFARQSRPAGLRASRKVQVVNVAPPELSIRRTVADIARLIERVEPVAIMPVDDVALFLAMTRELDGLPVAAATGKAAKLAIDKAAQYELARAAGLLVPPTMILGSEDNVPSKLPSFPLVVKPVDAVEVFEDRVVRLGPRIVSTASSLSGARSELLGNISVQPWIDGTGVGVFAVVVDGELRYVSAHRRVRMMNPKGSGSSACASIDAPTNTLGPIEDLLSRVSWDGIVMIELLRSTDDGKHWFMEVNGRAWGSMALALARGFTYPRWAVERAVGDTLTPGPTDPPARRARHVGRELVHLAAVWRGPGKANIPWPDRRKATVDVLAVHRADRIYNWRFRDPIVFFSDLWAVLIEQLRGLRQ